MESSNMEVLDSLSQEVDSATLTISDVILSTETDATGALSSFLNSLQAPNGLPGVTPSNAD